MNRLRLADPRSLKSRDTLARYELVRELAFGRFYSVYLARAPGDGRSVVIKRLRDAFPDAHARARMLREARVGLGMRTPQLLRVLELHDEPELFVVMEYVEGASLSELLAKARGKDVLRYVVPVLLDALRGLSALHGWKDETGAPGYLVHQAPSARHLLVGLDGLTRLVDLSNLYGRILGSMPSAQYTLMDSELAPEQAARMPLDPRCDLYILGGVLRHALSHARRMDLRGLAEVCDRATALRPAERYWSADEMAHALHFEASEAGLLASSDEVARWVRTSRASLIAATATAPRVRLMLPAPAPILAQLVLPATIATTTVIEALPPAQARPAVEPEPRKRSWKPVAGIALALGAGLLMHAYLDRAPPVVATPIAFIEPVRPAPVVPELAFEPAPVPTVEEVKPAAPKRARRAKPRPRAPQVEEALVLHEPEVLFYDEEDPAAAPRLGVPVNPF